jgi:hypothetical protein
MTKLVQMIEAIRAKLEGYRALSLKETPTRTIVIDPLLEALGWDVRDPAEVQLEYPTVGGGAVDYALKINAKPVLLVEAKPLDDMLKVREIAQLVAYAANAGIRWCILTNGLTWQVYKSTEECAAPEKLMFEVSLDPRDTKNLSVQHLAEHMWRFSREEMAKGTLDALGEQTFTDGKVRKALDSIMRDPPPRFINMVKGATGDESLFPQRIRESIARIWGHIGMGVMAPAVPAPPTGLKQGARRTRRSEGARKAWEARKAAITYDEARHTEGKPQEVLELYRGLERVCLSLRPGAVEKIVKKLTVTYCCGMRAFCGVSVQKGGLRVFLWLKYSKLVNPPVFATDVSGIGHWGGGQLRLAVSNLTQLQESEALIRQSLEARS